MDKKAPSENPFSGQIAGIDPVFSHNHTNIHRNGKGEAGRLDFQHLGVVLLYSMSSPNQFSWGDRFADGVCPLQWIYSKICAEN